MGNNHMIPLVFNGIVTVDMDSMPLLVCAISTLDIWNTIYGTDTVVLWVLTLSSTVMTNHTLAFVEKKNKIKRGDDKTFG